ncbi:MAG: 2Fe-2S iron-sulfur cluster binding domain-containing protein [Bacilli bacterium]|nr:2Fe-2S iron-sulfur cluster binding domain-containing protein [Bacilli bacterium]
MLVTFFLNNTEVSYSVKPGEYLADTLRKHGLKSIKVGCNESSCGSCTLLVDNKPMMSCSLLTASVEGKHITTIEGIQEEAAKISRCFSEEGADQCGFCNVGYALVVYSLKREYKNPTDEEINNYIVGNLCRCSGLHSQMNAIKAYLKEE